MLKKQQYSALTLAIMISFLVIMHSGVTQAAPLPKLSVKVPEVATSVGQSIMNWYQNQWFFLMRSIYDFYCATVAWTYVVLYNDGGANFYKCYYSVPYNIQWGFVW
eukprot:403369182